jgi:hypothetical protein
VVFGDIEYMLHDEGLGKKNGYTMINSTINKDSLHNHGCFLSIAVSDKLSSLFALEWQWDAIQSVDPWEVLAKKIQELRGQR